MTKTTNVTVELFVGECFPIWQYWMYSVSSAALLLAPSHCWSWDRYISFGTFCSVLPKKCLIVFWSWNQFQVSDFTFLHVFWIQARFTRSILIVPIQNHRFQARFIICILLYVSSYLLKNLLYFPHFLPKIPWSLLYWDRYVFNVLYQKFR